MFAPSGTFDILSMNVAGESGDKTTNTAIIGQDMAKFAYDVIHVQEDFNYHATLYAKDNHTLRTATSGGVPFGSGLNTLSNFDWLDLTRITDDCLTPKGFTFMRVRIDEGVYIDFYNLHVDAGVEPGDETAGAA
ncbi:Endonuclease/exonuclease/phosphatase [Mycena galopus ATCC 62051]|nr:Endonuclease/exonuclease/phosphatase [Mycena galopus ATCC 62051]